MDQAGWHMTDKLEAPANISIIALPAKSPELTPPEFAKGREHLAVHARQLALQPRLNTNQRRA
jgi:hypothetical protein